MAKKTINTAQDLLAHIGLKVEALPLLGAELLVKQWTASERIKYMQLVSNLDQNGTELEIIRPQAQIFALSLVDADHKPMFPATWKDSKPVFDDPESVESLVENRFMEVSEAFVDIAKFNGVELGRSDDTALEDEAVKN